MKVSIITASYNNCHSIKETIASVLAQDYPNIEYIIVDGGSKDGTVEYVKSLGNQISQFVSEPDNGIYDALNKGIRMATGDIVGFMHADDFFASNDVISKIVETFQHNKCDAVYGDLHYVKQENAKEVVRNWVSSDFNRTKLKRGWMPPHPTLYIKKNCYEAWGLYRTDYKIAADYELILRYFGKHQMSSAYLSKTIVKMRVGGASNQFGNLKRKMKEDYRALKTNEVGGLSSLFIKNISKVSQFIK